MNWSAVNWQQWGEMRSQSGSTPPTCQENASVWFHNQLADSRLSSSSASESAGGSCWHLFRYDHNEPRHAGRVIGGQRWLWQVSGASNSLLISFIRATKTNLEGSDVPAVCATGWLHAFISQELWGPLFLPRWSTASIPQCRQSVGSAAANKRLARSTISSRRRWRSDDSDACCRRLPLLL